jgi:pyrroline-5-carboxylate reductase
MLGFIGTGAITEAVVTGLCTAPAPPAILLSPRNATRAEGLRRRFANVSIGRDNQAVLDGSETVVLAVRPQDAAALDGLRFRSEQTVVSFIALLPMAALLPISAPATRICRAIPLPSTALRVGPMALWPALPEAVALLERVASIVAVTEERLLEPFWAATALMAPFFEQLHQVAGWLGDHGVAPDQAAAYATSLHTAWAAIAAGREDLARLRDESQTRGGLNEQALLQLTAAGHARALREALDAVLLRLEAAGKAIR